MSFIQNKNITDIPFENGFFIRGNSQTVGVNYYGEKLFAKQYGTPTAFSNGETSLEGVSFNVSEAGKFYYGSYKSNLSRWPTETTYFAIFYYYAGNESSFPEISITFPGCFQDKQTNTIDLTLKLQVNSIKEFQDSHESLAGKLIPILAYESATQRDNQGSILGDSAYGWVYPFVYQLSSGTYNIPKAYYGVRLKTTYSVADPVEGTQIPLFVLDLDNPQAYEDDGEQSSSLVVYSDEFSESCIIPDATATEFYKGNEADTSYVQTESVTSPVTGSRFYGSNYIRKSGLTGADYGLASGIAFLASNNAYIYTTGSRGVIQLFPNLSSTSVIISFDAATTGGTVIGSDTSTVWVNSTYGGGSGGWPSASKPGYTFKGWYTAATGGSEIKSNTKVTSNSYLHLYAQFTTIQYTITYNSNGGSSVSSQSYTAETNLTLSAAPTRTGYSFNSWKVTSAAGNWTNGTTYSSAQNVGTGKYGNITLTAQWSAVNYTISYISDGSTVGTKSYTIEDSFNLRAATTKTGYHFTKWKVTTAGGSWSSGALFDASQSVSSKYGNTTLTAQFEIDTFTITYYEPSPNGGIRVATVVLDWNTYVTINNAGGQGESNFTVTADKTISNPTRTGYGFAGYVYDDNSHTFTATWSPLPYALNIYVASGSTGMGTVSYGTGTSSPTHYGDSATIVATPNPGYEFVKWTISPAGSISDSTSATYTFTMPAADLNCYAQFRAITYTLSFNLLTTNCPPGITIIDNPESKSIQYRSTYPAAPFDPNWNSAYDEGEWDYEFEGWFLGGTNYVQGQTYTTVGNETWSAKWSKTKRSYTIKWYDTDGNGNRTQLLETDTTEYGQTPTYDGPELNKPGYSWAGRVAGWTPVVTPVEGAAEYDAVYQIITYNITYHPSNLTHSNPDTYVITDTPIILSAPERTGYEFVRWTSDSAGTQEATRIAQGETGNKEFWAWFVPVLSPFEPKPGEPGPDNNFFGLPDDLDNTYDYELKLSVVGDRGGMTNFNLNAPEGEFTTTGWQNVIDKNVYRNDIIQYLTNYVVFPMDVWRCVIHHPVATLKVELRVFKDGVEIGSSDYITEDFEIADVYKPRIYKVWLDEGVKSIDEMNLFTEADQRARFIGNKKSCILAKIDSTNFESGAEMLYGAVPTKLRMILNSDDDPSYTSGEVIIVYSSELVEANIEEANVETVTEQVYEGEWRVVSNDPFPDITRDITARLKMKIFDTRHNG